MPSIQSAPLDAEGRPPLDCPAPGGPHRIYTAVTNHCNRSCPWCSTCSSPSKNTWLTMEGYINALPKDGPFEVHLEGGEPLLHPLLERFVTVAAARPSCRRVIICTNGSTLPKDESKLARWLGQFNPSVGIKLSVNHHLLEHDPDLIRLAVSLSSIARAQGKTLLLNVRLRKGEANDDRDVVDAVRNAGLISIANVFFLRRYGLAAHRADWEAPILVGDNFRMVNPDGRIFGPDLAARSEAMEKLS